MQIDGLSFDTLTTNFPKFAYFSFLAFIYQVVLSQTFSITNSEMILMNHPHNQEYNDLLTLNCLQKSRYLRHVLLQDEHQLRNVDSPVGLIAGG